VVQYKKAGVALPAGQDLQAIEDFRTEVGWLARRAIGTAVCVDLAKSERKSCVHEYIIICRASYSGWI